METIVNNLIKAIGWSILHSLWQGAIIYGVLFIVLISWPKMTSRLKHNLSFGSHLLIFISFAITFLSLFEFPSAVATRAGLNQINYQEFIQFNSEHNFKTENYFPVVVSIYLIGIILQLVVLSSSYFKLKNLKKASTLNVPTEWKVLFEQTLSHLKIKKTVKFYLSAKVNVPLVIGFFKPVVLFPIALATQLDTKQVEAILIHELAHIRRNDYLINLIKTCIETLLFFNPFVWLTTKFIHIEREHACDDLVVNFTGTPLTYAHALLKLELLKNKQIPALSLAATGKNQHLYQRIKRITDMKTNYINVKQQFFILSLTIATVISLAWMNPEKKQASKIKKEKSLSQIKPNATEAKSLKSHLFVKADTDTTKTKKKAVYFTTNQNGKRITYTSLDEMPDSLRKNYLEIEKKFNSPEWKEKMAKIEKNGLELEKKFNSPEWKEKMAKIEKDGIELEKKFNSSEWKEKMVKLEKNGLELEKKFNSSEWKDKMAKLEKNGLELERKFNSPEWKEKMAKLEKNGLELERKFNSPEWKEKMAQIEKKGLEMEKKFNSPEWKDKMAKIEKKGLEMEKKFNSPEWKEKMAKLEKNSLELEKKFNSPEWKKKVQEMEKLQETTEYKELRKKYESDLNELKKTKGIKDDNATMIFGDKIDIQKSLAFLNSIDPKSLPDGKIEGIWTTLNKDFSTFKFAEYKPTFTRFEFSKDK